MRRLWRFGHHREGSRRCKACCVECSGSPSSPPRSRPPAGPIAAEEERLAEYYGFPPLEIYKLDSRISCVLVADFDGDGAGDIAVANNARSRIDLLLTTPGPSDEDGAFGTGVNRLASDRRMRVRTIPVNKEVVSLQAGDFDGDGAVDLAFYGTPAELVVLYNDGEARLGRPRRIQVGGAVESGSALAVGDLDRDGRADLALMTNTEIITVLQQEDGTLGRPERLPHTATRPGVMKLVDLDGDGGDDIAILSGGDDAPVRVRFSMPGGRHGPEERLEAEQARAIAYGDMDGVPGAEVLTVEVQSARASVLALREGPAPGDEGRGRLIFYPLPPGETRGRGLAVGDLDGDDRPDVVATDPTSAQVFVVRHEGQEPGLGSVTTYPGLVGGSSVRLDDLDGDGRDEVLVLSEKERQIGVSRFEDGRLSFPTSLPTSGGDPIGLATADFDSDGAVEILYVARQKVDGKDSFGLHGLERTPTGEFAPLRWGQVDAVPIEGLTGVPDGLAALDVNRDGLQDLVIFDPFAPPVLLLGRAGGEPPTRSVSRPGPLAGLDPGGLTASTLDDEAFLAAQGSFARSIALDASGQWEVRDQFNSGRTTAQIQAAAAIDLDGDGTPEVAMLDRTSKALLILERPEGGGAYRTGGTLSVGPLNFLGLHLADFDGDGRDDLLLAGSEKFGVVLTGGKGRRLERIAGYSAPREDGRLADLIAGDVNGDGVPDLILTDTIEHFVDIVPFIDGDLRPGLSFGVFEQKSFTDIDDLIEPRETALGDVDGDGLTDLILLVHDRVLVYRQDPGPDPPTEAAEESDPTEADPAAEADAG